MATEYKLSYAASEIDGLLDKIDNLASFTINTATYNGTSKVDFTTEINNMIDSKLGVIENGSY